MVGFLVDLGNIRSQSTVFGAVNVIFNSDTENSLDMLALALITSSKQTWYVVNQGPRIPS